MSDLVQASCISDDIRQVNIKSHDELRNDEIAAKLTEVVDGIMDGSRAINIFNCSLVIKYGTEHAKISTTESLDPIKALAARLTDDELENMKVEELSIIELDITAIQHLFVILSTRLITSYYELMQKTGVVIDAKTVDMMLKARIRILLNGMNSLLSKVKLKHLDNTRNKRIQDAIEAYNLDNGFLSDEELSWLDAISMMEVKKRQELARNEFMEIKISQINAQLTQEYLFLVDFIQASSQKVSESVIAFEES